MTEPIHVPIAHLSTVESVAWYRARDGRDLLLSAGHDDTIRGWDALTGRPHGPAYRGAGRNVVLLGGVALPGGPELILAVDNGGVYRWDAGTGEALGAPLRPAADNPTDRIMRSPTCAALVQPDGAAPLLVTGDPRGQLHRWDLAAGAEVGEPFGGHRGLVKAVCAVRLPDGRHLLLSGGHGRTVRRRDALTGEPLAPPFRDHEEAILEIHAALLPDGRVLVASSDKDVTLCWDALTGERYGDPLPLNPWRERPLAVLAHPDGRHLLATAHNDGTAHLWDPTTGTAAGVLPLGHGSRPTALAAGPGRGATRWWVASSSGDGTVRRWDLAAGAAVGEPLVGHGEPAWQFDVARSPGGRAVLASGGRDEIRLWDLRTGEAIGTALPSPRAVNDFAVARPAGGPPVLCATIEGGGVVRWDALSGTPLPPVQESDGAEWGVATGTLPDGRALLVAGCGFDVHRWDAATGEPWGEPLTGHTHEVKSVVMTSLPDGGPLIAAGDEDGTVRRWHAATGAPLGPPLTGHEFGVVFLTAARIPAPPDGSGDRVVLVSSDMRGLRCWDAVTGEPVGDLLRPHGADEFRILDVATGPGLALLATVDTGRAESVRWTDLTTGEPVPSPVDGPAAGTDKVTGLLITGTGPDRALVTGTRAGSLTIQPWPAPPPSPDPLPGDRHLTGDSYPAGDGHLAGGAT